MMMMMMKMFLQQPDQYAARPESLQNICLAKFVVNYEVNYSGNITDTGDSDNESQQLEDDESG